MRIFTKNFERKTHYHNSTPKPKPRQSPMSYRTKQVLGRSHGLCLSYCGGELFLHTCSLELDRET